MMDGNRIRNQNANKMRTEKVKWNLAPERFEFKIGVIEMKGVEGQHSHPETNFSSMEK